MCVFTDQAQTELGNVTWFVVVVVVVSQSTTTPPNLSIAKSESCMNLQWIFL